MDAVARRQTQSADIPFTLPDQQFGVKLLSLKFRRETRETSVNTLVLAKNGPTFHTSDGPPAWCLSIAWTFETWMRRPPVAAVYDRRFYGNSQQTLAFSYGHSPPQPLFTFVNPFDYPHGRTLPMLIGVNIFRGMSLYGTRWRWRFGLLASSPRFTQRISARICESLQVNYQRLLTASRPS